MRESSILLIVMPVVCDCTKGTSTLIPSMWRTGTCGGTTCVDELPRLTAEQTAERLGVKVETLYAYVARGRLSRMRGAGGSLFDPLEVERFASLRRPRA